MSDLAYVRITFAGKGRIGVPLLTDGTYQPVQKSQDPEVNKMLFYSPYNEHIIKVMPICSAHTKVTKIYIDISFYIKLSVFLLTFKCFLDTQYLYKSSLFA